MLNGTVVELFPECLDRLVAVEASYVRYMLKFPVEVN